MKVHIGRYPSQKLLARKPDAERKVSVRIDPHDLWSLDSTLAYVILPALKALKEVKHGSPFVPDADVPVELRRPEGFPEDDWSKTDEDGWEKRWDWVLDEMIWAFEQVNTDWEDQFYSGTPDLIRAPVDAQGNDVPKEEAKFFELRNGPDHTFVFDKNGHAAYSSRMQNGFALFGRYYMSLWD